MLAAFIIVFREVMEAGMIVGIVAAVMRGVPGRMSCLLGGLAAGLAGSALVACFVSTIAGAFAGSGSELFNASILGLAVVMLAWHNVWMSRHGKEIASDLKQRGRNVAAGRASLFGLAIVVAIAVMREGSEVVLFLYGIVVSNPTESGLALLAGGVGGLIAGALLSALTYAGLVSIPARHLFAVTGALIALLAAGMAAQMIAFLQQGGFIDVLSETAWNTSGILSDHGIVGRILHTLVGYSDRPTRMQVVVYVATLAVIATLMKVMEPKPAAHA